MVLTRKKTAQKAVENEAAINAEVLTDGQKESEDAPVTVRRSSRPRRESRKYQSPGSSPARKGSTTPESPEATLSSESESDSEELVEKKPKKIVQKGKKGKNVVKKGKKEEEKPGKKKSGKDMTEYERMIQKNIEERNAFLANMLKGEGDSFEEEKPVKSTSRKKKKSDSSNDADETEVQKPKKTRKVAKRRREESSDGEDEEPEMTYNTRSRGTTGRPRGIYKERDSDEESGAENDMLSDAADVSDGGDDDETRARKKTRSYKKTRTSAIVTKKLALLVQKREELKAKQGGLNVENVEKGNDSGEENGEEDEKEDKMDEDYIENDSSSGDGTAKDEEAHEDESLDESGIETTENNNKIIISSKNDVKMNPKGEDTKEESDQNSKENVDNDKPIINTPSLKRRRDIDDSEDCISPKKIRRIRSEESIEENSTEKPQDIAYDGLTPQ